jgi:hypothetical protein
VGQQECNEEAIAARRTIHFIKCLINLVLLELYFYLNIIS